MLFHKGTTANGNHIQNAKFHPLEDMQLVIEWFDFVLRAFNPGDDF